MFTHSDAQEKPKLSFAQITFPGVSFLLRYIEENCELLRGYESSLWLWVVVQYREFYSRWLIRIRENSGEMWNLVKWKLPEIYESDPSEDSE